MGLVGLVHRRKVCSYYLSWKLKAMMYRMVGLRFELRKKLHIQYAMTTGYLETPS